jgi:hypothetical protein
MRGRGRWRGSDAAAARVPPVSPEEGDAGVLNEGVLTNLLTSYYKQNNDGHVTDRKYAGTALLLVLKFDTYCWRRSTGYM